MTVAVVLEQEPWTHSDVALAQWDTVRFGQAYQALSGAVVELGVGRKRDGFLLHRRIHRDAFQITRFHRLRLDRRLNRCAQ